VLASHLRLPTDGPPAKRSDRAGFRLALGRLHHGSPSSSLSQPHRRYVSSRRSPAYPRPARCRSRSVCFFNCICCCCCRCRRSPYPPVPRLSPARRPSRWSAPPIRMSAGHSQSSFRQKLGTAPADPTDIENNLKLLGLLSDHHKSRSRKAKKKTAAWATDTHQQSSASDHKGTYLHLALSRPFAVIPLPRGPHPRPVSDSCFLQPATLRSLSYPVAVRRYLLPPPPPSRSSSCLHLVLASCFVLSSIVPSLRWGQWLTNGLTQVFGPPPGLRSSLWTASA
jgi:hypothetical protein